MQNRVLYCIFVEYYVELHESIEALRIRISELVV